LQKNIRVLGHKSFDNEIVCQIIGREELIWTGNNEGKSTDVTRWNFMVTEGGDSLVFNTMDFNIMK
jgi:hypothetical protein